jgi:asparaginyl-tRNA synthetase
MKHLFRLKQPNMSSESSNENKSPTKILSIAEILAIANVNIHAIDNKEFIVNGWIKNKRDQGKNAPLFLTISDGTSIETLQVVFEKNQQVVFEKNQQVVFEKKTDESVIDSISMGCSVSVTGIMKKSPGKGQLVELHATSIKLIGTVDQKTYPLVKAGCPLNF